MRDLINGTIGFVGRTPWSAAGPPAGFRNPLKYFGRQVKADEGVRPTSTTLRGYRAVPRSSRIADETASGFSRGRKCPAPSMTRRATSDVKEARSAGEESADGRAIPSLAPYKTIVGTEIFGR